MSESKKNILTDVKDETKKFDKKEIEDGKAMSILSYLGLLALVPFFAEKKNKYVRYHAKQGMNLLLVGVAYGIVYSILTSIIKVRKCYNYWGYESCLRATPGWLYVLLSLVGMAITALCIIGIVNVCQNKAKELPLVNKIKVFK